MAETQELLERFVKDGSESAFCDLAARYVDLVYSTAVRLVDGDTHRAEDVSQIVFADLARMAGKLSAGSTLGGWLHRHTCFVARTVMRGERRRQARERQAAEMNALNDQSVLAQIAPILDEAIQELGADDRDAIVLRFFERRNLRSVGEALGINENVAQKRVSRAVEELGMLLQRRGVALPAAALASGLAVGAVTPAPAGLALGIAGSVFAGVGTGTTTGLTAAKLTAMAKLKLAIACAMVVAALVTLTVLYNQSSSRTRKEARMAQLQTEELNPPAAPRPARADAPIARPSPDVPVSEAPPRALRAATPENGSIREPTHETGVAQTDQAVGNLAPPIQRFAAKSGSRLRIEGTSNLRDWLVEGPLILGFLELSENSFLEGGRPMPPGRLQAEAEAVIQVGSLRSVTKDGRPYDDKMDEIMHESLKMQAYPKIVYRLGELFLTGTTNHNGVRAYEFESHGELAVAGVTNEIRMPVFIHPMGADKFKVSGRTSMKMTSFGIDPPKFDLLSIETRDEVTVLFDWVVGARPAPSHETQAGMVPLTLELPTPAFENIPKDLRLGSDVERLADRPRAPIMVPPGLANIAPGAVLSSSDRNATADTLAKITDGDKNAEEQSIIFLRKGPQWVQMDFERPQEIFAVVIWHAHNTAKVYHDVIVQAADDTSCVKNLRTLFNNDRDNSSGRGAGKDREYLETYEGKLINTKGVKARYLRFFSHGSTESALNEYTEIEVYGRPPR